MSHCEPAGPLNQQRWWTTKIKSLKKLPKNCEQIEKCLCRTSLSNLQINGKKFEKKKKKNGYVHFRARVTVHCFLDLNPEM